MINIDLKAHKESIEAYAELKRVMKKERDTQLQEIRSVNGKWKGKASSMFRYTYEKMLVDGSYEQALGQVNGICGIMEEAWIQIEKLKSMCDNFDSCLPGGKSCYTVESLSGELMLESSIIPRIDDCCDTIMETGSEFKSTMQDVMDMCGGIIDFESERSALSKAFADISKIQTLRDRIDAYARGVIDLDSNLSIAYSAWTDGFDDMGSFYGDIINREFDIKELLSFKKNIKHTKTGYKNCLEKRYQP